MNFKKILGIIFLNLVFCKSVFADNTIYNYSSTSTYNKKGWITGNIGIANSNDVIQKAKSVCKDIGFKLETQRFDDCVVDLLKISDSFELARTQEYILSKKIKTQNDVEMSFSYQSKSGENINKESKWNKFWGAVGYIISEHGEEIINAAVDLKYGTSNSTTSSGSCVTTRSGNVIHQHCPGMYCSYVKVGNVVHRNCRQK